jgi:two-component system, NarL family, invasion response regulator UvrY
MAKRIIIADDHAVVRAGLQLILDGTEDLAICDEATTGQELIEKLKKSIYDLVILDISMPGKDTLDTLIEIKNRWEKLPVVIFSMNPDEVYSIRMLKNGASAYINKEINPNHIIEILRTVLCGKKYFSPYQMELMIDMVGDKDKKDIKPHESLTDREFQIMIMIVSGIRKTDIAIKLMISKNTIGNHRNNILKKLNLSSNSELVRYAIQHQLVK